MAKDRNTESEKKAARKSPGTLGRYSPERKTGEYDDYFLGLGKKEDIAVLSATVRSAVAEINHLREYMAKDQEEINRLNAETRLMIDRLLAA